MPYKSKEEKNRKAREKYALRKSLHTFNDYLEVELKSMPDPWDIVYPKYEDWEQYDYQPTPIKSPNSPGPVKVPAGKSYDWIRDLLRGRKT